MITVKVIKDGYVGVFTEIDGIVVHSLEEYLGELERKISTLSKICETYDDKIPECKSLSYQSIAELSLTYFSNLARKDMGYNCILTIHQKSGSALTFEIKYISFGDLSKKIQELYDQQNRYNLLIIKDLKNPNIKIDKI